MTTLHYSNPALDAELAYRRELLASSGRSRPTRPVPRFRGLRRRR